MEHAFFQTNAALIAATCVSTEVTRYYLNGIAALTPWGKNPEPTEVPAPELSEMLS